MNVLDLLPFSEIDTMTDEQLQYARAAAYTEILEHLPVGKSMLVTNFSAIVMTQMVRSMRRIYRTVGQA